VFLFQVVLLHYRQNVSLAQRSVRGLCGKTDWRMPTIEELQGLLVTTPTENYPLLGERYINGTYFPNTKDWFWSSTGMGRFHARLVHFGVGNSYTKANNDSFNVRLVRG
jgi:hypothetical protein